MRKYIPNVLTAMRLILFMPLLVWLTYTQQWTFAVICFSVGLVTNVLDGYLARRWNVVSKLGADILQPICDFVFAAAAVVMLIVTGRWSIWVGVLMIVIAVILQLISFMARWFPFVALVRELKRHQSYIHPLYSAAVMFVAWFAYIIVEDALSDPDSFNGWLWLVYTMTFLTFRLGYGYIKRMVEESLYRL